MPDKWPFWRAMLLTLMLASCTLTGQATPVASPLPSPAGSWTVRLSQSGGFAGVQLSYQAASDGRFSAQDMRSGRHATGTLAPGSLNRLQQLVSEAGSWSAARPSACADCFIYDLELTSSNGTIQVHADDISVGATGAEEVINLLAKMRDDALAGSN